MDEWAFPIVLRLTHAAGVELAELLQRHANELSDENRTTLRDLMSEVQAIDASERAWQRGAA